MQTCCRSDWTSVLWSERTPFHIITRHTVCCVYLRVMCMEGSRSITTIYKTRNCKLIQSLKCIYTAVFSVYVYTNQAWCTYFPPQQLTLAGRDHLGPHECFHCFCKTTRGWFVSHVQFFADQCLTVLHLEKLTKLGEATTHSCKDRTENAFWNTSSCISHQNFYSVFLLY